MERQNLAIIDDRDIEALPLSAHINAGPRSHASKHAPLQYRPHPGRMQDLTGPRLPSARHRPTVERNNGEAPRAASVSSELWFYDIADGPVGGMGGRV